MSETEPETGSEPAWRRLHGASVLVNLVPRTLRVLWSFWPLGLAALAGRADDLHLRMEDLFFLAFFLFSGAVNTVVHWATLRYRVLDGRLELRVGLLNRQARVIDRARIQNIGLVRNPFHKLAGLVEVRIETAAGDGSTEGLLSALTEEDALELVQALRPRTEDAAEVAGPVLRLGIAEVLGYGLSRGTAGLVALLWVVLQQVGTLVFPELSFEQDPGTMAAIWLLALALAWAGSGLLAVIRHFRYELTTSPDQSRLRSDEGLITRRHVDIPLRKVQLVISDEPLLRRMMGYATVSVETAGLGAVVDGQPASELLIPMVEREELDRVVRVALPESPSLEMPLRPPHKAALIRAMLRTVVLGLAAVTVMAALAGPWALVGLLGLAPVLAADWLDFRFQGWAATERVIVARSGFWRRRTVVLDRRKLQSVQLFQGPIMRLLGIGRVGINVAGSGLALPELAWEEAEALVLTLRPAK